MSTSSELKQLEAEVQQLEEAIEWNARATKRGVKTSLCLGAALVVVIVTFLGVNYVRLRSEMTQEKLAKSFSKEISEVSPAALQELNRLGQDLLPVYASELKRQIEAAWPEVAAKLEAELSQLGDDLFTETHSLLSETEQRVLETTGHALAECFPELKDPARREDLERRLQTACEGAILGSIEQFDSLYSKDVARVEEALLRFDLTDTHETPAELQKRFIHLWIQLLDQEVMEL